MDNVGYKLRQDIEDLILMISFADETALTTQLPIFVTADPARLPLVKLMEGDLQCVLNKRNMVKMNINNLSDNIRESSTTAATRASNTQRWLKECFNLAILTIWN